MSRTLKKRLIAGASALALSVTGVAALGGVAIADVGPDQPEAPTSGSLTIHKYIGNVVDQEQHNGTELGESPTLPMADGVEFTIQRVGKLGDQECDVDAIDLTTPSGWEDVEPFLGATPTTLPEGFCLEAVDSRKTEDGVVTFGDLPLGLYYVTETGSDGATVTGTEDPANIIQPAAPFYVTVPFPSGEVEDGDDTVVDWTYDVHVYPKNQASTAPEKEIADEPSGLVIGSTVEWTITVTIPKTEDPLTQASVYDQLDERLEYVPGSSVITIGGTEVNPALEPDTTGASSLEWNFTDGNLAAVNAARGTANNTIVVSFKTKVVSVGDGEISNEPGLPGNGYGSKFNDTPTPGEPEPFTYWGQLEVTKVDESNPALGLEGAEFAVYAKGVGECAATAEAAGTVVATGTSGAGGVVLWDATTPASSPLALWVANSNEELQGPSKDYCVYETKAPAGYTAVAFDNPVTITPNGGVAIELTVENAQKDGPDLPLTGANGTVLMMIGGAALIALAGGVYLVSRRRQAIDAS